LYLENATIAFSKSWLLLSGWPIAGRPSGVTWVAYWRDGAPAAVHVPPIAAGRHATLGRSPWRGACREMPTENGFLCHLYVVHFDYFMR
jgi:hypothetical protein